ncbi:segregation/condensation protein A [Streptomyces sp. NPDC002073]
MPPTDEPTRPARTPRRALGRGPGASSFPVPGVAEEPEAAGVPEAAEESRAAEEPAGGPVAAVQVLEAPESAVAAARPVTAVREPLADRRGPDPEPATGPEPETGPQPEPATGPEPAIGPEAGDAGAGVVPDGRFTVRLANFEGPFDLLLQLISRHRLDVTEVALHRVTDEFMAHIRAMGADWDLDQTTEFLVVAATLLDLKAARLLPTAEVEDEADLALLEARDLLFARLLQYRAYKRIAEIFEDRLAAEGRRHPRTVGLEEHHAALLPEVVITIGAEGFARLAVQAMQPRAKPQVYVDHIHAPLVSVQEQAGIVVRMLREAAGGVGFRELVEDAPDTLTVVARFLALLELYRERAVLLDQEEALGTLTVRWTGGDGAGDGPLVTDEFDVQVVPEEGA